MHIEKFNNERMELIKQLLQNSVETGKPQDYEIRVDGMRVVPRTNDPELFDKYEDFVKEKTREILVMLYEGVSKKNMKYLFHLRDEDMPQPNGKALSGIEVEKIVSEKLEQQKQQMKQEQIEKENKEMKKQLQQNTDEMEKAAEVIQKLKGERDLADMNWGKIIGVAGDTLIRNNTHLLAKVPFMSGLAGILEADNKMQAQQLSSPQPKAEASFKIKEENSNENEKAEEQKENPSKESQLTEEQRDHIGFIRSLEKYFSKDQVEKINFILNFLVNYPEVIEQIVSTIKEKTSTAKTETKKSEPQSQFKKSKPNPESKPQQEKPEEKKQVPKEEKSFEESDFFIKEEETIPAANFEKEEETENLKKEDDFKEEIPSTM